MTTEVNQNFFAWSQEETSVQDLSQGTSQMFGHGSISFGRFDLESLEWEKWSVFTNDRRHEEFGKFNGLVAKKKAYFEEYFKRIRELKALQQQDQQTELHLEYCGDGSDSSQTGEYEPAAAHGAPTESETLVEDSTKQTAAATTFEHGTECYGYHENGSLVNEISAPTHFSPVGDLQHIGKQMKGSVSGKMDILKQDANSSQDVPMIHEIMITPNKRAIEKDSRVGQASKTISKTVKGPCSGEPSVINQMAKPENILSLRRPREATSDLVGTTARSGITGVRRPSAALQRPSTKERRPVTKDASRKHAEVTTPCRPSTSERRTVTGESALKPENNAIPCRPVTAHRRPITKESATRQCSIATPRRPSTADRRPATKDLTPKLSNIAAPHRPSTAHRRPISKESAPKHFNVASPHRPSTVERHTSGRDMTSKYVGIATSYLPSAVKQRPITGEGAHKHADVVTLSCSTADRRPIRDVAPKYATLALPRRPSTAERHPIARDIAPKNGLSLRPSTAERRTIARNVEPKHAPAQRPSTAERRPVTRETVLKQANVANSCLPLTPDRRLTKKGDISTLECPSTGGRCPITSGTALWSRTMPYYSKGALVTEVTPQKTITPRVVRNSKLENLRCYAKERVELQVDRKQKSSLFNLSSKKTLTSNVRDDQGLEMFKKPNKEGGVRAHAYKSNNATTSWTGNVKTKAPVPPPLPPRRPYCTEKKPNVNSSPVGGRKTKASAPHWH
ncbi:uncharacterized protein [Zea mays]|uniref:TPX2 (Targeting protein for Xklp2) protein family n=1 Tax=Zea mays TaxID=4577 RepID=A0A804PZ88_MAIZE|nr:uncharacterized protein LOC100278833 isoform X2 [Zea mays]|eukprot:XP_020394482.1 uncharacterized protein LOC100278833 isoform X2 [Zea mays]